MNVVNARILFCAIVAACAAKSALGGTWASIAPISTPRAAHGVAAGQDGKVYVIGGEDNSNTFLASMEVYDPATASWANGVSMPTPRLGMAVVVGADGRIYVIGGANQTSKLRNVEVYDPSTNSWTTLPPLASGRESASGALGQNGKIYVFGGVDALGIPISTVEVYDPATNAWSTATLMPTPRYGTVAAAAGNGLIYIIGGFDAANVTRVLVEAYDPIANSWVNRAQIPYAVGLAAAAVGRDGKVYVAGGIDSGQIFNSVVAYDPIADLWSGVEALPRQRFTFGAATAADGRIFAVGGQTGSWPSATSEANTYATAASQSYRVCLLYDSAKAFKSGSTIPLKLTLCDASGSNVSSAALVVRASGIVKTSSSSSFEVQDAGNANPDNDFRFDPALGASGGYIFNLKTTGLSAGTYNLQFTVAGGTVVYAAPFQLK